MNDLLEYLNKNGVMSRPFWVPMNKLPMYCNNLYVSNYDISASIHRIALSILAQQIFQTSSLKKLHKQ